VPDHAREAPPPFLLVEQEHTHMSGMTLLSNHQQLLRGYVLEIMG
jgi:hypothetical protein